MEKLKTLKERREVEYDSPFQHLLFPILWLFPHLHFCFIRSIFWLWTCHAKCYRSSAQSFLVRMKSLHHCQKGNPVFVGLIHLHSFFLPQTSKEHLSQIYFFSSRENWLYPSIYREKVEPLQAIAKVCPHFWSLSNKECATSQVWNFWKLSLGSHTLGPNPVGTIEFKLFVIARIEAFMKTSWWDDNILATDVDGSLEG